MLEVGQINDDGDIFDSFLEAMFALIFFLIIGFTHYCIRFSNRWSG